MPWLWIGVGFLSAVPLALVAAKIESRRVRQLERRARGAERLAELGRLTGGLAHEIKNPLSTVSLNIQLLQEDLGDLASRCHAGSPEQDQLGRIQRRIDSLSRETLRLRDILEDFLRFAGRVKLHRERADVHALIEELVDFYSPQAQSAMIHLRTQLTAQPSCLSIDTSLLKQALLNLLINASQAMTHARDTDQPHGGSDELLIRTDRDRVLGQDEIRIHITDTGPGITPEHISQIFQPYFSTKKHGTGLGLPTARRIIEEHGGTLSVHAEPGRGTDFTITLPTDQAAD